MEQLIEERPVLKKKSFALTAVVVVIIALIPFIRHFWCLPVIGTITGAIVVELVITAIIIIIILILWDSGIKASAEEKSRKENALRKEERLKQTEATKNEKVLYTIECVEEQRPVRWNDLIYIARYYTASDGTIDISKFSKIFPFIHLAELKQLIAREEINRIYWNGGSLHIAFTLIETVAKYYVHIANEPELMKLVGQLQNFLSHCEVYKGRKGYSKILTEVKKQCPTPSKFIV